MTPEISERPGGFLFEWKEAQVKIDVGRTREHRDGRVTGEIHITTTREGYEPHLHQALFNFSSAQARRTEVKNLTDQFAEFPWKTIFEQLCSHLLRRLRQGEEMVEISTEEELVPPDYLLWPLLPRGMATIIFGEKGAAKSTTAQLASLCVLLPWLDNEFGLQPTEQSTPVLYLDWETTKDELAWKLKMIATAHSLPFVTINYRRCALPLADDMEAIAQMAEHSKAGLLVIDSLGMAAGGDLWKGESPERFYAALRRLNRTTLILAQTSKDENRKKSIYGSTLFGYWARSIWEARKSQELGEKELSVALFHREANTSGQHEPLGWRLRYSDDNHELRIEQAAVTSMADFLNQLSATKQIHELLLSEGALTVEQIAEKVDLKSNTVRQALGRMRKRQEVVKLPDKRWGLQVRDS